MSKEELNLSGDESNINIDEKLIEEGSSQLTNEISVLEAWLQELDESEAQDAESIAARKSYNDMLRSRKEMLNTLAKQSKLRSVAVD